MSYIQGGRAPLPAPMPAGPRRSWYAHPAAVALGLLIFPPFGIWAVWRTGLRDAAKWVLTVLSAFWLILLAAGVAAPNSPKHDGASHAIVAPVSRSASPTASAGTASPTPTPTLDPTTTSPTPSPSPTPTPAVTTTAAKPRTPAPPVPATHRAAPRRTTAAPDAGSSDDILSPSGRHYAAGQFCPKADLGLTTHDVHGALLRCEMISGRAHWRHA